MQRKLSEIAEIPKILSSTLETVSQTFEKFIPDNDDIILDNTDPDDNNDLDDNNKDVIIDNNDDDNFIETIIENSKIQHNDKFNLKYHFQPINDDSSLLSEKESGTQDDLSNPDDPDFEENNDTNNNNNCVNKISNNDINDDDEEYFEADSLDEDFQKKFLNRINDSPESDYISEEDDEQYSSPIGLGNGTTSILLTTLNQIKCMPELKTEEEDDEDNDYEDDDFLINRNNQKKIEDTIKKEKIEKINQLERCWPWADRQKIIYKESTCHLVPKLSIVEKRIKQLGGTSTLPFYNGNHKDSYKSEKE